MDAATGDGPIDAVYSVLQRITGVTLELLDYQTRAVTQGKDAQGEANIQVRHGKRTVRGRGVSTDVIEAAAKAYLSALNRIAGVEKRRGADQSHAWVGCWLGPEHGWVDLDPTNNLVVKEEHVVLGWGRDFRDVTPLRGVILGGSEHELSVRVELEPAATGT